MKKIFRPVVDFLFYQECVFCQQPNLLICAKCLSCLPRSKGKCFVCGKYNPFFRYCHSCHKKFQPDLMIAPFAYSKKMKQIIQMMKFEDVSLLAESFSETLANLLIKVADCPVVVPIPLNRERLRYRGYNQSRLIAEGLCHITGWKMIEVLERKTQKHSQVEAGSKMARKSNIKGVFKINSRLVKGDLPGEVVLIDDVITTGATMEEACKVLKVARVKKVIACSLVMGK